VTVLALIAGFCVTRPAAAYVDLAPTLGRLVGNATRIAVVEVERYVPESRALTLREVRPLLGEAATEPVRHQLAPRGVGVPRHALEWAEPGARAVLFVSGETAIVCVGRGWYQVQSSAGGWWRSCADRPDLSLAFHGRVAALAEAVEAMLAGKTAVVTALPHGTEQGASFDLALNRTSLPGLVKVQRMRVSKTMPTVTIAVSTNPAYVVGQGPVDEADIPALLERLGSTEPSARAEAAEDVRWLGKSAGSAALDRLAALLDDPSPRVRSAAAAARLAIVRKDGKAVETLGKALDDAEPAVRRDAARAVALAGPPAGSLAPRLTAMLKDADTRTRMAALLALATLGRATGAAAPDAAEAIRPLLDEPDFAIDAADALGRLGAASRPAMTRLAVMLKSEQAAERWAAMRAMAQIGGPDSGPAAEFIARTMPEATEFDGYNLLIYTMLLGPDAKPAEEAVRRTRVRNPVLPSAALWAMEPDKALPWERTGGQGGGRFGFGGPPGFGPPPGGPGGPGGLAGDVGKFIFEGYIREGGPRLVPTARLLLSKILDGSAGDFPEWAYGFLSHGDPEESVATLLPHLKDESLVMRERAAVVLGHMGPAAASAKDAVAAAEKATEDEGERRLLRWCLREIGEE
jgi:HEAT repeat protein